MTRSNTSHFLGYMTAALLAIALTVTAPSLQAFACVPDASTCCWPPEAPFDYMATLGRCEHTDCPSTEERKCVNDSTPYAWFTDCYFVCWPDVN